MKYEKYEDYLKSKEGRARKLNLEERNDFNNIEIEYEVAKKLVEHWNNIIVEYDCINILELVDFLGDNEDINYETYSKFCKYGWESMISFQNDFKLIVNENNIRLKLDLKPYVELS